MLERMCLPAIVLDRHGFVLELNAMARAVLDTDINIKDNRLCVRDREAYGHLKVSLDEMTKPVQLKSLAAEPILIRRRDKFPVVLRTVPFKEPTQSSEQEVHALVTLTACRRDPGHPRRCLLNSTSVEGSESVITRPSLAVSRRWWQYAAPLSQSPCAAGLQATIAIGGGATRPQWAAEGPFRETCSPTSCG